MKTFSRNSSPWEPPLELQRSTPREVRFTAAGKAAVIGMMLLITAAVVSSALLAAKSRSDEQRWTAWQADAVSTRGEVTGLRKRGSGDDARYYVDYSYQVDKTSYAATGKVRSGEWRRLNKGMALPVFYRGSEPGQSWIAGHEPRGVPSFAPVLTGLALLFPVPFVFNALRRQKRLLEEGRAALAKVVTMKKVQRQHHSVYRVRYEFRTLSGGLAKGKAEVNKNVPAEGSEITVLYHPDDPEWNTRYPLSLVRVASDE